MKILVTGADGFIGSHLIEALVRDGHEVRAFVLYNSFNSWGWLDHISDDIKGGFEVVSGDIRDPYGVRHAMQGVDAAMHLAALIAIPYSYIAPDSYIETNVRGTLNLLQAARDLGVKKIIHTSTSEVYGTAQYVPIDEAHPLIGQSPYSASKISADQLAYSFYSSFELPVVTVRPFNTYGPRQSARAVIPAVIAQILSGTQEIEMGLTSPTRDFNYVKDTVQAYLSVLKGESGYGEVFNIGSSFEISIRQTAELIANLLGVKITIKSTPERIRPTRSEVERLWADNSKINKYFGWSPEFSGIDGFAKGLGETIDWFKNPSNLSMYKANIYNR